MPERDLGRPRALFSGSSGHRQLGGLWGQCSFVYPVTAQSRVWFGGQSFPALGECWHGCCRGAVPSVFGGEMTGEGTCIPRCIPGDQSLHCSLLPSGYLGNSQNGCSCEKRLWGRVVWPQESHFPFNYSVTQTSGLVSKHLLSNEYSVSGRKSLTTSR